MSMEHPYLNRVYRLYDYTLVLLYLPLYNGILIHHLLQVVVQSVCSTLCFGDSYNIYNTSDTKRKEGPCACMSIAEEVRQG